MSRLVGKPTMWFPTRSDTNRPVQSQKRTKTLKFRKKNCTIRVAKTKALIGFAVTAKLICVFVFAYADCWFSHDLVPYIADLFRHSILLSITYLNMLMENISLRRRKYKICVSYQIWHKPACTVTEAG